MCELMALNFARPVEASFSMREFSHRGKENADGWGLAWYPDESVALIKEAISWHDSHHTTFLESYSAIHASIVIGHVRHLTVGRPVHADTHPFTREMDGVDYCFAHNGTVPHAFNLPLGNYRPVGRTDSEAIFCHLLDVISGWKDRLGDPKNWPRLRAIAHGINQEGKLNFLLTDGKTLVCYHDLGGWKGLHFKRMVVHNKQRPCFRDDEVLLQMESELANRGTVLATHPLSPRGWKPLRRGEMIVLQDGAIRYSSHSKVTALAS